MAQTGQGLDTLTSCKSETSSPMSRVLGTYELLERILLHLPLKNLYVLQRVSTTWRDLIERSKPIQQKMFIAAAQEPQCPTNKAVENEFSQPLYPTINDFRLNPLLHTYCALHGNYSDTSDHRFGCVNLFPRCASQEGDKLGIFIYSLLKDNLPAVQDMLVCQPPITTMQCLMNEPNPGFPYNPHLAEWTVYNPQGLRFRNLVPSSRTQITEFQFRVTSKVVQKDKEGASGSDQRCETCLWSRDDDRGCGCGTSDRCEGCDFRKAVCAE